MILFIFLLFKDPKETPPPTRSETKDEKKERIVSKLPNLIDLRFNEFIHARLSLRYACNHPPLYPLN